MADPMFPVGLPGPEWGSLNWSPLQDNAVRSTFPGGMKQRRRFTWMAEKLTCTLYLTAAQLQVLLDFHDLTCQSVLPFQWWDFRKPNDTGSRATYAFLARPNHTTWADIFRVELQLQLKSTFSGSFPIEDGDGGIIETDNDEALTT